jgi:hypothetical protein
LKNVALHEKLLRYEYNNMSTNQIVGQLDTSGAEAIALMNPQGPSVSVYMPFNIELEDLTAELFGQTVDLSGTIIKVRDLIPAGDLYDPSGEAWLHFLQAADEDTFSVIVNREKAADVSGALAGALHIADGETYEPTNKGVEHLDASGAFGDEVGAPWYNYASLQDFLMGYFAKKVLGHPGALAAISNDSVLRAAYTTKYHTGMNAIYGTTGSAVADVGALASLDVSGVTAAAALATVIPNGLSDTDLHIIVQQMMNQAPDRFADVGDRGTLCPVQWKEDDKIYVQLKLAGNSYKLNSTPAVGANHPVLLNATNNSVASSSSSLPISDDYYVLEFTVGA